MLMTTNSQAILYTITVCGLTVIAFLLFQWTDYFQEEKSIKGPPSRI